MNNPEGIKALVAKYETRFANWNKQAERGDSWAAGHARQAADIVADLKALESLTAVAGDAEVVAWCKLTPNGGIEHFDGKPMIMVGPVGNYLHPTPLCVAPTRQAVEGMVLVPREPTIKMHNAAAMAGLCGKPPVITEDGRIEWACADPSAIYRVMLAAAPQAGKGDGRG